MHHSDRRAVRRLLVRTLDDIMELSRAALCDDASIADT